MRILALDTATPATLVALCDVPEPAPHGAAATVHAAAPLTTFEARDEPAPGSRPNHTTRILELIEAVFGQAGMGWESVERIAVGTGPGTFTGLRIGIATAQALAVSRGLPLVGVSTLDALALAIEPGRPLLAVLDARRGEAFAAAWSADRRPPHPPHEAGAALAPQALAELAARHPGALAVGDGALGFQNALTGAEVPPSDDPRHRLSAVSHARLAAALNPGEPGAVRPSYLREPDAVPRTP